MRQKRMKEKKDKLKKTDNYKYFKKYFIEFILVVIALFGISFDTIAKKYFMMVFLLHQ